jgi:predicted NUDIX family phosphoesterase
MEAQMKNKYLNDLRIKKAKELELAWLNDYENGDKFKLAVEAWSQVSA